MADHFVEWGAANKQNHRLAPAQFVAAARQKSRGAQHIEHCKSAPSAGHSSSRVGHDVHQTKAPFSAGAVCQLLHAKSRSVPHRTSNFHTSSPMAGHTREWGAAAPSSKALFSAGAVYQLLDAKVAQCLRILGHLNAESYCGSPSRRGRRGIIAICILGTNRRSLEGRGSTCGVLCFSPSSEEWDISAMFRIPSTRVHYSVEEEG